MRYFLTDYETGAQQEVTKEQWEGYKARLVAMYHSIQEGMNKPIGQPLLFGTGGGLEQSGAAEMFYNPSYAIGCDPYVMDAKDVEATVFSIEPGKVMRYFTPAYDQL